MLDYIIGHQQSTWPSVPSSPGGDESRPESFSPLMIWLVPLTSRPYPEALSSSWTSVILAAHKMAHHLRSSKDFRSCMPRTRGKDQLAIHYITSTYPWSQVGFFLLLSSNSAPQEFTEHSCSAFQTHQIQSELSDWWRMLASFKHLGSLHLYWWHFLIRSSATST